MQWIEDAGIIVRAYNLSIIELPLDGNAEEDVFIKLGEHNVGRTEQILTLPLYMAFLLTEI